VNEADRCIDETPRKRHPCRYLLPSTRPAHHDEDRADQVMDTPSRDASQADESRSSWVLKHRYERLVMMAERRAVVDSGCGNVTLLYWLVILSVRCMHRHTLRCSGLECNEGYESSFISSSSASSAASISSISASRSSPSSSSSSSSSLLSSGSVVSSEPDSPSSSSVASESVASELDSSSSAYT
jgi:hypothetical protein